MFFFHTLKSRIVPEKPKRGLFGLCKHKNLVQLERLKTYYHSAPDLNIFKKSQNISTPCPENINELTVRQPIKTFRL